MIFPPRIYLTGFMGSGKTHAGRLLANAIGYSFVDLDEQIASAEGCSVADLFEQFGEAFFREKERSTLHATASLERYVISCGGGAPCFFDNAQWINTHGVAVFLDIPLEELARRLETGIGERPLLKKVGTAGLENYIAERLAQRRPFYEMAAVHCNVSEAELIIAALSAWVEKSSGFAGIDFGSKLAGTTVIAYYSAAQGQMEFISSAKGEDADAFILSNFVEFGWRKAFLDAPLSLPGVYRQGLKGEDYFHREADRQAKAMSPMFLGGLTARAMRLSALLQTNGVLTLEVYPGQLAKTLELHKHGYKTKEESPSELAEVIQTVIPHPIPREKLKNWHVFDALLAYASGWRYVHGKHVALGDPEEGLIII